MTLSLGPKSFGDYDSGYGQTSFHRSPVCDLVSKQNKTKQKDGDDGVDGELWVLRSEIYDLTTKSFCCNDVGTTVIYGSLSRRTYIVSKSVTLCRLKTYLTLPRLPKVF